MRRVLSILILTTTVSTQATANPGMDHAATPVGTAESPLPVSPIGSTADPCPTFSWSEVSGSVGYELVVFGVTHQGEVDTSPSLTTRLPAGAHSWTPSTDLCLTAGGRYAWLLRATSREGSTPWSEPALFQVDAAGGHPGEIEAALAILRRHLAREGAGEEVSPDGTGLQTRKIREAGAGSRVRETHPQEKSLAFRQTPGKEAMTSIPSASAPTLTAPSLTVSSDIALSLASDVFKAGTPFLWDDWRQNLGVGRSALSSTTTGYENTAVGNSALFKNIVGYWNTATGTVALYSNTTGIGNTASGFEALYRNEDGFGNTAHGARAVYVNTTGDRNTGVGFGALNHNQTGSRNIGIGAFAGLSAPADASDSIFIGSHGDAADTSPTIRLGTQGTQTRAFAAGIFGTTTGTMDAISVVVDSTGQLGTVSSSRQAKQDIREMGVLSDRLLELRPVAFRYKEHAARNAASPMQFGLIAEEVAEIFPELLVYDEAGKPLTVKYQQLSTLLLDQLQRERSLREQQISVLRERLTALEGPEPPKGRSSAWWRRVVSRDLRQDANPP